MIKKIIYYYFPWLLIMATIFYLSSVSELVIVEEGSWDIVLRKVAHIGVYLALYISTYRLFVQEKVKNSFAWSAIFTIIYAVSDEYHQTFVFGRVGAISDVLITLVCFIDELRDSACWVVYLGRMPPK
jgi:VanZ family protein